MTRISKGAIKRQEKLAKVHERIELQMVNETSGVSRSWRRLKQRFESKNAYQTARRAQMAKELLEEANKIKKKFRKNYKKQKRWKEIELQIEKLLGRRGQSNKA